MKEYKSYAERIEGFGYSMIYCNLDHSETWEKKQGEEKIWVTLNYEWMSVDVWKKAGLFGQDEKIRIREDIYNAFMKRCKEVSYVHYSNDDEEEEEE